MELPLFPLHLVLFPGRPLPLHLFEPRYRQMLADCLDDERRFGVVAIRSGREVGEAAEIFDVGTVAEIESVTELPDGRCDISVRGQQRFRIRRLLDGTPYLRADVDLLPETPANGAETLQAQQLRALLAPYLTAFGAPEELLDRLPQSPDALAWLTATALHVEVPEQQRLLELTSTQQRLGAALRLLRRESGLIRHFGAVGSLQPHQPSRTDLN